MSSREGDNLELYIDYWQMTIAKERAYADSHKTDEYAAGWCAAAEGMMKELPALVEKEIKRREMAEQVALAQGEATGHWQEACKKMVRAFNMDVVTLRTSMTKTSFTVLTNLVDSWHKEIYK